MPYAHNQGVKIYYEVEGHGPPLIFAHGATGDLSVWRTCGYVDRFKHDYTVILFDVRGHGQSDKPHDVSAYNYRFLADDVIAVLDTLPDWLTNLTYVDDTPLSPRQSGLAA